MKKIICITTICIVIIGICYIFLRHDPTENVVKYYNTKEMTYEYSAKDAVSNLIMRFDGKMECDKDTCIGCQACVGTCPVEAISPAE